MNNKLVRQFWLFVFKVLRKTGSIFHRFSRKIYGFYLNTLFIVPRENNNFKSVIWEGISKDNLSKEFFYKDETWNDICFLNQLLKIEYYKPQKLPLVNNECKNNRTIINKDNVKVKVAPGNKNRWVFMTLKKSLGSIYALDGYLTIFSTFTEIQFGFNYESITKRLRFMIVNNKEFVFEVVENGGFYRPVKPIPISLKFGIKYHIRMEIVEDIFNFFINGKNIMSVKAKYHKAKNDQKFVLIFFDFGYKRMIDMEINKLKIYKGSYERK